MRSQPRRVGRRRRPAHSRVRRKEREPRARKRVTGRVSGSVLENRSSRACVRVRCFSEEQEVVDPSRCPHAPKLPRSSWWRESRSREGRVGRVHLARHSPILLADAHRSCGQLERRADRGIAFESKVASAGVLAGIRPETVGDSDSNGDGNRVGKRVGKRDRTRDRDGVRDRVRGRNGTRTRDRDGVETESGTGTGGAERRIARRCPRERRVRRPGERHERPGARSEARSTCH